MIKLVIKGDVDVAFRECASRGIMGSVFERNPRYNETVVMVHDNQVSRARLRGWLADNRPPGNDGELVGFHTGYDWRRETTE